jgi:hypothetical protein
MATVQANRGLTDDKTEKAFGCIQVIGGTAPVGRKLGRGKAAILVTAAHSDLEPDVERGGFPLGILTHWTLVGETRYLGLGQKDDLAAGQGEREEVLLPVEQFERSLRRLVECSARL